MRALCEIGVLFHILYLKLYFELHTSYYNFNIPYYTLYIPHFILYTSHCIFRTPNFILHTPYFTIHTSHFLLLTTSFTLQISHFTLHTAFFMPHTSQYTFYILYFILSEVSLPYSNSFLLILSLLKHNLNFRELLRNTTTNHCRNLDIPTAIRFTKSSCKKQKYYAYNRGKKQP